MLTGQALSVSRCRAPRCHAPRCHAPRCHTHSASEVSISSCIFCAHAFPQLTGHKHLYTRLNHTSHHSPKRNIRFRVTSAVSSMCRPHKKTAYSWGGICALSCTPRQWQGTLQQKGPGVRLREQDPTQREAPLPTQGQEPTWPHPNRLPCK